MSTPTVSDLFNTPTQQQVLDNEVYPELRQPHDGVALRVNDWTLGGVYRSLAAIVARLWASGRQTIAAGFTGSFEDYAFGRSPTPNGLDVSSFAPELARQRYGVKQIAATYTLRNFLLTNTSTTAYGPISPGGLIVLIQASGNRYVNNVPVTIPAATVNGNGSVVCQFRSEFVQNTAAGQVYADASSSVFTFVTSQFPGVSCTNVAPPYNTQDGKGNAPQAGPGVGIITPSGTPVGSHFVTVRIGTSGTIAGASVVYFTSYDGAAEVNQGATSTLMLANNITLNFDDNGGSPSFLAGTKYFIQCPGSDITTQGRDLETAGELGIRVAGLLPLLGFQTSAAGVFIPPSSPTIRGYETLALSANTAVKLAMVATDPAIAARVNITIAQQGAPCTAQQVANVQAFFNAFNFVSDIPVVATTSATTITIANLAITIRQAFLKQAQTQLQRTLGAYIGGVDPVRRLGINGLVSHAYIIALVTALPGFVSCSDVAMTINAVPADLQLPVTPGNLEQAALPGGFSAASAFTWSTTI